LQLGEGADHDGLCGNRRFTEQIRRHRAAEQKRDAGERPGRVADDDDSGQYPRERLTRAEPADKRRIDDQEKPGFAQQSLRQIEERCELAGAKGENRGACASEDRVGRKRAAQEVGWDHHRVSFRVRKTISAPIDASSPLAVTMTARQGPIHYVAGNGSAEFRVIGLDP